MCVCVCVCVCKFGNDSLGREVEPLHVGPRGRMEWGRLCAPRAEKIAIHKAKQTLERRPSASDMTAQALWYLVFHRARLKPENHKAHILFMIQLPPLTSFFSSCQYCRPMPGAVMGGPARDEVMKKIPGRQGRPGPHLWWGHKEKTWQARIRDPPGWPPPLPHPVSSPLFCCCSCLPCCGFLCCLPRALLLLFHWVRTNWKP